jgi:hypothetical protein
LEKKKYSWPRVFLHVFNWTRVINTRGQISLRVFYTRVQLAKCIFTRGQLDTCINTRVQMDTCNKNTWPIGRVYLYTYPTWPRVKIHEANWTRIFLHVSILTRVRFTHVQMDTCIFYTRPNSHVYVIHVAKWNVYTHSHVYKRHVAIWPRVYSNCYCRHAANCCVFCSVG